MLDLPSRRIVVTGGGGFLGSAVCRALAQRGCSSVIAVRRTEFDLTDHRAAARMYGLRRPDIVIHAAGAVGGIAANAAEPGRFFHDNMAMALHLIEQARIHAIEKFILVGTMASYPADAPLPLREADLWRGYPEAALAPYGIAKRAAGEMLAAYRRQHGLRGAWLLPINLYGPGDHFDGPGAHVVAALIDRFMAAAEAGQPAITCWGTGRATREFLFVDDAAEAIIRAAERVDDPAPINLGPGRETSIADLAGLIARLSGFQGEIRWDASKPDGAARRCADAKRAKDLLEWRCTIDLETGLRRTIEWRRANRSPSG
jgi:GDP-L-fucose synthase